MEKITLKNLSFVSSSNLNKTTFILGNQSAIGNLSYNSRIINAEVFVALKASQDLSLTVKCKNRIVERIKETNRKNFYINVTDLVMFATENSVFSETISMDGIVADKIDQAASYIDIEYELESKYSDTHTIIEKDLFTSGEVSVDVSNGKLCYDRDDVSVKANKGKIGISHHYNSRMANTTHQTIYINGKSCKTPNYMCGKGFKLNLQQYIYKTKTTDGKNKDVFYYIDGKGNVIDFRDSYYYNKPIADTVDKAEKIFVEKSNIDIAIDGRLTITIDGKIQDVFLEQKTDSGMRLSGKMEDFKGVEYMEQRLEEIANLEEENKQIKDNIISYQENLEDINYSLAQITKSYDEVKDLLTSMEYLEASKTNLIRQKDETFRKFEFQKKEEKYQDISNKFQSENLDVQINPENIIFPFDELSYQQIVREKMNVYFDYNNSMKETLACPMGNENSNLCKFKVLPNNNYECTELCKCAFKQAFMPENFCLAKIFNNIQYLSESAQYSLQYDQKFIINLFEEGADFAVEGALQAQKALIDMRSTMKAVDYEVDEKSGAVTIDGEKMEIDIELLKDFNSYKYPSALVLMLLDMTQQLKNIDNEKNKIKTRLSYFKTVNNSYTDSFEAFKNFINTVKEGKDVSNQISDKNTIYYQYYISHKKIKAANDNIAKLEKRMEKNNVYLKKYISQTAEVYLMDSEGSVLGFTKIDSKDEHYTLTHLRSADGKTVVIDYHNGRIVAIKDEDKDCAKFKYNNNNHLSAIEGVDGTVVKYQYSKDGYLNKITNSDDFTKLEYLTDKVSMQYGYLKEIIDAETSGLKISYTDKRVGKIENTYLFDRVDNHIDISKIKHDGLRKTISYSTISYTGDYTSRVMDYVIDKTSEHVVTNIANYQFDVYGKTNCEYEGLDKDADNVVSYNYQGVNRSYTAKRLNNCESVILRSGKNNRIYEYYLGDKISTRELDYTRYMGNKQFNCQLNGEIEGKSVIEFEVDPQEIKAKDYIFTAFVKADSAFVCKYCRGNYNSETMEHNNAHSIQGRKFELRAKMEYTRNNSEKVVEESCVSFDWLVNYWQYLALPVVISDDENMVLDSLKLYIDYSKNVGICEVEDIDLVEAQWEYTESNEDNQPTFKENCFTEDVTRFTYDDNKRLVKSTITRGKEEYSTKYEYDMAGKLLRKTDFRNMVEENIYDDKDNLVKSLVYSATEPAIKNVSQTKYDEDGRALGEMDSTGQVISEEKTYTGDRVTSVKYPNGAKMAIGYDTKGRVIHTLTEVDGISNANVKNYTLNQLTMLKHNDMQYEFSYDALGRNKTLKLPHNTDEKPYITIDYSDKEYQHTATYANGDYTVNTSDFKGNLVKQEYFASSGTRQILTQNFYNRNGDITKAIDTVGSIVYNKTIEYDKHDRATRIQEGNIVANNEYDVRGNVIRQDVAWQDNSNNYNIEYQYDDTPSPRMLGLKCGELEQTISYDAMGRVSYLKSNNLGMRTRYLSKGEHATDLVSEIEYSHNEKTNSRLRYKYDLNSNIERVIDSGRESVKYRYDGLNRLVREDNRLLGKTYTYEYDAGGNIVQKSVYSYDISVNLTAEPLTVIPYSYRSQGWTDQLMHYGDSSMQYDIMGNPTIYKDIELTWECGRRLAKYGNVTYRYTADGLRKIKTNGSVETKYDYLNGKLFRETVGYIAGTQLKDIFYYYGADGIHGITCNGESYKYRKDFQGNITHILDSTDTVVARYVYDAWGNHSAYGIIDGVEKLVYDSADGLVSSQYANHIANINPIRYRGYYYDQEISLYYLQSRYYDPAVGRFINADDISYLDPETLGGLNLYAYCGNNPVMLTDSTGTSGWSDFWRKLGVIAIATVITVAAVAICIATVGTAAPVLIGAGIGFGLGVGMSAATQAIFTGSVDIGKMFLDGFIGAISGAVSVTGIGLLGSMVVGGALSGAASIGEDVIDGKEINVGKMFFSMGIGALGGLVSGSGTNAKTLLSKASYFKSVLKTAVSPKKIAMYTAKQVAIKRTIAISSTRFSASIVGGHLGSRGLSKIFGW